MLLQNDELELRAMEYSDGDEIMNILKTPAVADYLFGFSARALDMEFSDWLLSATHRKNEFYFTVTQRHSAEVVGVCSYQDIDYRNGRVSIWAASQAYKPQVIAMLATNAFEHLRMEHVALYCLADDTYTINTAESAGFTRDAIFYSRIKKSGKSADVLVYTLLKGEEGDT